MIDFLIKKRIGKAIPEPELRMIGFLIKTFIGSRLPKIVNILIKKLIEEPIPPIGESLCEGPNKRFSMCGLPNKRILM